MRVRQIFFFLYLYINTCCFPVFAQQSSEFQAKYIRGTLLPHHESIAFVVSDYQNGVEFQYNQRANHISIYDSLYRFPKFGIGYQFVSLGNTQKLGYASNLFGSMQISLFSNQKSNLGFEQNLGLSYIYSPLEISPYNTALSSRINFYAGIDIYYEYRISQTHTIKSGIELSHISNGKIKTPNLGLNSIGVSMAYIYTTTLITKPQKIKHIPRQQHALYSLISGAYKSDDFLGTKKYHVASALLEYKYVPNRRYGILAGINSFYDQTIFSIQTNNTTLNQKLHILEYGIHSGIAAHYNNMYIFICSGMYIKASNNKPPYYSKVGIRYSYHNLLFNFSVKSHKTTADFLECGIGVYLYKSKQL